MVTQVVNVGFLSPHLAVSMLLIYTCELWHTVNKTTATKPKYPPWNLKSEDGLGEANFLEVVTQ